MALTTQPLFPAAPPLTPCPQDFQFFNIKRLTEIYEKDNAHEVHKHALAQVGPLALHRLALTGMVVAVGTGWAACACGVCAFTQAQC